MRHVSLRSALLSSSSWLLVAVLSACASDDDLDYQMPSGMPAVVDAQISSDASATPAAADSGVSGPITPADAQISFDAPSARDAQPLNDAQLVDAQPNLDAQPAALGDAAFVDAALSEAGVADAAAPRMDLGKGSGKDVITIGDSWMLLLFTGIQESLVKASGGQPYRKYAFPGTRLLDGAIPGQYRDAKSADPNIKTVVMTGGGNDIIQNATLEADCQQGGTMCQAQLEKIGMALSDLWAQMSKDGVMDVIHVMYSASAGSGVKNREENNQKLAEACAAVPPPLRCHLLDTDALITEQYMRSDGIHPSDEGYDRIGKAAWELMVKEGMRR